MRQFNADFIHNMGMGSLVAGVVLIAVALLWKEFS